MTDCTCFECHSLRYRIAVAREERRFTDYLDLLDERDKHHAQCHAAMGRELYHELWPNADVAQEKE